MKQIAVYCVSELLNCIWMTNNYKDLFCGHNNKQSLFFVGSIMVISSKISIFKLSKIKT
jgi:hypothetical protein